MKTVKKNKEFFQKKLIFLPLFSLYIELIPVIALFILFFARYPVIILPINSFEPAMFT